MHVHSVINVGSSVGGTFRCAVDMMRALPDCTHSLTVATGGLDRWAKPELAELGVEVCSQPPVGTGLVICHNTRAADVPKGPFTVVYYAHSVNSTARKPPLHVDLVLCVSKWLAHKLGHTEEQVLYQPVSVLAKPACADHYRREDQLVVGRICTPQPKKWVWEQFTPYLFPVMETFPDAHFEFVGAPKDIEARLTSRHTGPHVSMSFMEASPLSRQWMHTWDVLLYTSETEESFGRVVREAQRCGCFPIVSDRGGFVEQIAVTPKPEWGPGHLIRSPSEVVEIINKWMPNKQHLSNLCQEWGDKLGSLQAWRTGFLSRLQSL